jgi:hypothetical protein
VPDPLDYGSILRDGYSTVSQLSTIVFKFLHTVPCTRMSASAKRTRSKRETVDKSPEMAVNGNMSSSLRREKSAVNVFMLEPYTKNWQGY